MIRSINELHSPTEWWWSEEELIAIHTDGTHVQIQRFLDMDSADIVFSEAQALTDELAEAWLIQVSCAPNVRADSDEAKSLVRFITQRFCDQPEDFAFVTAFASGQNQCICLACPTARSLLTLEEFLRSKQWAGELTRSQG